MRKLTLDVDELKVESFETADAASDLRGTIRGHLDPHTRPYCPGFPMSARCDTYEVVWCGLVGAGYADGGDSTYPCASFEPDGISEP